MQAAQVMTFISPLLLVEAVEVHCCNEAVRCACTTKPICIGVSHGCMCICTCWNCNTSSHGRVYGFEPCTSHLHALNDVNALKAPSGACFVASVDQMGHTAVPIFPRWCGWVCPRQAVGSSRPMCTWGFICGDTQSHHMRHHMRHLAARQPYCPVGARQQPGVQLV